MKLNVVSVQPSGMHWPGTNAQSCATTSGACRSRAVAHLQSPAHDGMPTCAKEQCGRGGVIVTIASSHVAVGLFGGTHPVTRRPPHPHPCCKRKQRTRALPLVARRPALGQPPSQLQPRLAKQSAPPAVPNQPTPLTPHPSPPPPGPYAYALPASPPPAPPPGPNASGWQHGAPWHQCPVDTGTRQRQRTRPWAAWQPNRTDGA